MLTNIWSVTETQILINISNCSLKCQYLQVSGMAVKSQIAKHRHAFVVVVVVVVVAPFLLIFPYVSR